MTPNAYINLIQSMLQPWYIVVVVVASSLVYTIGLTVYRLCFSPIAHFPGPKLAAATGWLEFYWDVIVGGRYLFEIEKMHDKYGPIVRITPDELSIRDVHFYNEVYVSALVHKTNKYSKFVKGVGLEGSSLLTVDHHEHRARRRILDPFFSRFAIRRLEPLIASLLVRFERTLGAKAGRIVRLDHAFTAWLGDSIRAITCDHFDTYLMDDDQYSPEWYTLFATVVKSCPLFTAFPSIIEIVNRLPDRLVGIVFPPGKMFNDFKALATKHIEDAKRDKAEQLNVNGELEKYAGTNVFRSIINSNSPEELLSTERLTKEAQGLFGAATVASARVLDTAVYYLLANDHWSKRLADELADPMKGYPENWPTFTELEQLPFLHAVVNESLRLTHGSMHRMPRCFPDTVIQYKQWSIPRNTPIGMSNYFNHTDAEVFPEPSVFTPERWLGDVSKTMKDALTPFTRGSRSCLGKNLATCETHMMLAMLFRPGGPCMSLYETDQSDVDLIYDYVLPLPKHDTKGIRVRIH